MWANDFPHSDSTWPWSQDVLAEHARALRARRSAASCTTTSPSSTGLSVETMTCSSAAGPIVDGTGAPAHARRRRHPRRPHRRARRRAGTRRRRTHRRRRPRRGARASSTSTRTTTRRCSGTACSRSRRGTASPPWSWATAASASRRRAPSTASSILRTLENVEGMSARRARSRARRRLAVRDLPRVPRRGRAPRHGHQRRRAGRPHAGAALRDGRGGDRARRDRRRDRARCARSCARRSTPARSASRPRSRRRTSATTAGRCRAAPPSSTRSARSPARSATPGAASCRRRSAAASSSTSSRQLAAAHRAAGHVDGAARRHAGPRARTRRCSTQPARCSASGAARRAAGRLPAAQLRVPLRRARSRSRACRCSSRSRRADRAGKARVYADPAFRAAFRERARAAGGACARALAGTARSSRGARPSPRSTSAPLAERRPERGHAPVDLVLDLALASDLEARFRMAVIEHRRGRASAELLTDPDTRARPVRRRRAREPALRRVLLDPPARPLGAREGPLTLESAVRMLTSRGAELFGIADRGRLAVGARPTSSCSIPTRSAAAAAARARPARRRRPPGLRRDRRQTRDRERHA